MSVFSTADSVLFLNKFYQCLKFELVRFIFKLKLEWLYTGSLVTISPISKDFLCELDIYAVTIAPLTEDVSRLLSFYNLSKHKELFGLFYIENDFDDEMNPLRKNGLEAFH